MTTEQARYSPAAVTLDGRYLAPPSDSDGKLWVRTTATIQGEPHALYELWRDVENAPAWQEDIQQVTRTGDRISHWIMQKGSKTIEWDAEVLIDEPGKRIAWRSIGGDLEQAGEVIFSPAPAGRGTVVSLLQEFKMGKIASFWETLTGRNPKQGVIENLRHFQALAETGEIPRTQGQPHGPRGAIGSAKESAYAETVPVPAGETRSAT